MTEERFEELVNLYLDNEIGRHDLAELKHAIKDNLVWRRKFERACQLHQAASKALSERTASAAHSHSSGEHGHRAHSSHSHRSSTATGRSQTFKEKLEQVQRNASVDSMAERQASTGAAATISMNEHRKGGSSSGSSSRGTTTIPFFTSTLGMLAGGLLATAIIMGILFAFYHQEDEYSDLAPVDPAAMAEPATRNTAELDALLPGLAQNDTAVDAAAAMRARFFAAAIAGNSVTRTMQLNYYSIPAATPPNLPGAANEGWRVQITENTYIEPVKFDVNQASPATLAPTAPATASNTSTPGAETKPPNVLMP